MFACMHAGLNEQWGLSNELFVLGDSVILTVLGQVSFMPVLVLAARLCPEVSCLTCAAYFIACAEYLVNGTGSSPPMHLPTEVPSEHRTQCYVTSIGCLCLELGSWPALLGLPDQAGLYILLSRTLPLVTRDMLCAAHWACKLQLGCRICICNLVQDANTHAQSVACRLLLVVCGDRWCVPLLHLQGPSTW